MCVCVARDAIVGGTGTATRRCRLGHTATATDQALAHGSTLRGTLHGTLHGPLHARLLMLMTPVATATAATAQCHGMSHRLPDTAQSQMLVQDEVSQRRLTYKASANQGCGKNPLTAW